MPVINLPVTNPNSPLAQLQGGHVAVRVPDLQASIRWYVEKLDFRVLHQWPFGELNLAYLAPANDDNFWVELLGDGTPGAQPEFADLNESLHPAGYHHFCLNVHSVDEVLAELRRQGVTIKAEPFDLPANGRRLAFIADPWGNLIELAQVLA